jgi:tetratricopeptide (TPR) repeat protein
VSAGKAAGQDELSRAIRLFEEGRYAEALAGFKACVRHGDSAEVREYLRKAAAHLTHGAVGVQEDPGLGAALDARDFAAAEARARALFEGDKRLAYRALRDHFLKGVLDVPEDAGGTAFGCFFLASQAWKHGRTLQALERLARGAAHGPRYAWMRYYIAELLMRRADLYEPARAELDAVVKACPWLWEARFLRAELRWTLGEPRPLAGLDALEADGPSRSALLAWRGALKLWTGRAADAVADLDAAAAVRNPDAPCWRGGAEVVLGRLDAAVADLTTLLKGDPTDHEARVWRGEALRRLGRLDEARADLDQAIARSDGNLWAFANRALVRLAAGDLQGAREDAARLAPPAHAYWRQENAPGAAAVDAGLPGYAFVVPELSALELKTLLEETFAAALGCRRWDPHLNMGWMRRAGAPVPPRPSPLMRLRPWLASRGLRVPPELVFGPETITPEQAAAVLAAARPGRRAA